MDEEEIDRIVAGVRVPDGLVLMDQYREIFKGCLDDLDNLDPDDVLAGTAFVMGSIGRCYSTAEGCWSQVDTSRASDVVTTLAYFVMRLASRLTDEERMEFLYQEYEEYEQELGRADCLTPWWDLTDVIEGLAELFEEPECLPTDMGQAADHDPTAD